jgi:hypothetical protein
MPPRNTHSFLSKKAPGMTLLDHAGAREQSQYITMGQPLLQ